jgi:hypothetical protein
MTGRRRVALAAVATTSGVVFLLGYKTDSARPPDVVSTTPAAPSTAALPLQP